MAKKNKQLSEEAEKLNKKIKALQQQLKKANKSIDAIKNANIDALVIQGKKDIKVYTEKTADKTYRILIEKMHEGAVTLNEDGTILYCNSYFAQLVNLPLQKVIGEKFKKFIEDSSKERLDALIKLGWKSPSQDEITMYTNKARSTCVLMSINTLSINNTQVLSIILTDLTIQNNNKNEMERRAKELEQKNKELKNANKDLISFTYISSHDLQEPLRKIQNFVTVLLEEEEGNLSEIGKGYFSSLRKTAKRMQALIEDLLMYSRTNSDHKFEESDLNLIIDEIANEYEDVIKEKKATIEAANLGKVRIIRFQLHQLMQNLISNSLKFSKPQTAPRIIIKSRHVPGSKLINEKLSSQISYCHIIYTDNGIGFDPQYNERIFEVFQRLHGQNEYKGTGMGLAICKRIIENHNGIITASGKVNKGTRFDMYIPDS
jgi:signal transduction histidine kinase